MRVVRTLLMGVATLSLVACDHLAAPAPGPALTHLVPAGGATGVDPAAPIVLTFSHPMMQGMETLVTLHEGSLSGPAIGGTWSWSTDRTVLTFTPASVLKSQTTYVLELAPTMRSVDGRPLDHDSCNQFGGHTMTGGGGMMGGGMMGGGGSYGMTFTFTTA